jgi:hypothetical protein
MIPTLFASTCNHVSRVSRYGSDSAVHFSLKSWLEAAGSVGAVALYGVNGSGFRKPHIGSLLCLANRLLTCNPVVTIPQEGRRLKLNLYCQIGNAKILRAAAQAPCRFCG